MTLTDVAQDLNAMTGYLFRKLSGMIEITDSMRQALKIVCTDKVCFKRGTYIIQPEEDFKAVYLVSEGWATRSKMTDSGARQIINFAIPGDFLCFNAALFPRAEVFVRAQTEVEAFAVPIQPFSRMLMSQPQLAIALAWTAAQEEGVVSEHLLSLGRRNAVQRMAHLFCEVHRRLKLVDLVEGDGRFGFPLTQEDLADVLGISLIHTNRVIRTLVKGGLIRMTRSAVEVTDLAQLERIAGFDDSYLHHPE